MPEMNGRRLSDEIHQRRPDIKVLFTTGYTRDAIVHNGTLDVGVSLITKPFTLDELARKVAEVLRAACAAHRPENLPPQCAKFRVARRRGNFVPDRCLRTQSPQAE